ncbi:hypothetical protein [Streptomyces cinereoruber]|uniref:hypothetical protein n=1 Tax=Streptomyces cinereoruber TaxID=67260 RepID=UPI00362F582A
MTAGRGRPARFDEAAQQKFLDAVAQGMRVGDAARLVGVDPQAPRYRARQDAAFAEAFADAKARGKEQAPHSESHYVNHGCRAPECRAAAAKARAARRGAAKRKESEEDGGVGPVELSSVPGSLTALSLRSPSSPPGRVAA